VAQTVTLRVSEDLFNAAKTRATQNVQSVEDVLLSWLNQGADLPVNQLSDQAVLELSNLQLSSETQEQMSDLLAKQREEQLNSDEASVLARLMHSYRHGQVRKAEAYKVAVERGLLPRL
jgi:uncharacterized membrane protein YgaE (UPF0421/DUF939 family)